MDICEHEIPIEGPMMDHFSIPRWAARNPLGIIALFISLIYGMSALLLGASIDRLSTTSQTILVVFVAIFPFVVLGVFAWLVAVHHRKLYGPGDYRSDESFLNSANALPPSALGERLRQEISQSEADSSEGAAKQSERSSQTARSTQEPPLPETENHIRAVATSDESQFLFSFAIESLVFQELQREFEQAITRGVAISRLSGNILHLDGLIEGPDERLFIEIKMLRSLDGIRISLQRYPALYKSILEELKRPGAKRIKFLLAVVYLGQLERNLPDAWFVDARKKYGEDILIRFYSSTELLSKYGFTSQSPED